MMTEKRYRELLKKIREKTATKEEIKEFQKGVRQWQKLTDNIDLY